MKMLKWCSATLLTCCAPAGAQRVALPAGYAPGQAIGYGSPEMPWTAVTPATPMPVAGKQETFSLVTANTVAAPVTLYGGNYVVTQACGTYGTVMIRYRGPDGATMQALLTKNSGDVAGGTLLGFGANAVVDAALTGTTGCNVQIARVPS